MDLPQPNKGKALSLTISGKKVYRYPVKTQLIMSTDDLYAIVREAVGQYIPHFKGRKLFIGVTEKAVASSQGRGFPIKDIKPSSLANFLVRFVHKSDYGIGLGSPETMEIAIREAGVPRIILAAFIAAVTKPLGMKGMFYRVAGKRVRSIDGPVKYALPPFNQYAVLGAKEPDTVAKKLHKLLDVPVFIMDSNDIGANIIGSSGIAEDEKSLIRQAYQDNFWGNTDEQTPVAMIVWD
ncbi:MAG: F420-0:Gamma-glutamyl ligase [candidate division WS6 bacterium OLB20]|uniref:F420-0:Gamma-glutamyl ligase n=1 Tax=candidate division WS6 bacterium OLB20 TaxID=1617426 RepID=A0A136LWR5_9BACT|nr:MAG: F420-0:Gamma-glutamyl ligase [candidate division WS6 bacterium OLB20]